MNILFSPPVPSRPLPSVTNDSTFTAVESQSLSRRQASLVRHGTPSLGTQTGEIGISVSASLEWSFIVTRFVPAT